MDIIQKTFDDMIERFFNDAQTRQELEKISKATPDMVEKIMSELPSNLLKEIKNIAPENLQNDREFHRGFVRRNYERWQTGFDIFEALIAVSVEAGDELNRRVRSDESIQNDLLFDVLSRLHARACLISKEINCLLKNGFPDGAHARWRALHELNITARFISNIGIKAAKRYVDHEIVESYKAANQLREHESKLNVDALTEKEFSELKERYDKAIDRYGKRFKKPYGWAAPFINTGYVRFVDIEEAVGFDHWRPYYKWASQKIHSDIKGIRNFLGLTQAKEEYLLVGPSNSGMTSPADSTAISLSQITITFLHQYPNIDSVVIMKIVLSLSNEVGEEFLKCEKETQK